MTDEREQNLLIPVY